MHHQFLNTEYNRARTTNRSENIPNKMCSIGEDDFGDEGAAHTMPIDPKIGNTISAALEICKKCNERDVVIKLNLKDAQCEQCFYQYVRHKFRASMGATRIIERGAKVLIVFDGTIESCVMFDMVRFALFQERFKRLTIEPIAVFIDTTCMTGQSISDRREYVKQTFEIIKQFEFETYYVSIADVDSLVKINDVPTELSTDNDLRETKFLEQLNSINNQTAKEDYLSVSRSNLIREIGSRTGCKFAFISTISHQIAYDILTNVALGRGNSVANQISFCDNRTNSENIDESRILRPMRTITTLEIETYVRFNEILAKLSRNENYFDDKWIACIQSNSSGSIQSLTKQFIYNLQENFESTVSTVFRTGDKIGAAVMSSGQTSKILNQCKFCHSNLDYENSATLFAIEHSRCISACADQHEVNDIDMILNNARNKVRGENDDGTDSIMKFLCHGCRNIFRDLDPNFDKNNLLK